jgi:hypothetical protein
MVNQFGSMIGVTVERIEGSERGSESMTFYATDGRAFKFYHYQGCCESVFIEDVCGDVEDLIGSPLVLAEEVSNSARQQRLDRLSSLDTFEPKDLEAEAIAVMRDDPIGLEEPVVFADSYTWTFYRFGTAKGSVTVRWLGTSNGYYSEGVSFEERA